MFRDRYLTIENLFAPTVSIEIKGILVEYTAAVGVGIKIYWQNVVISQ